MRRLSARGLVTPLAGLVVILAASGLSAQGAPRKGDAVIGEVVSVDAPARRVSLRSDAGASIAVSVPDDARVQRAKPGATDLTEAVASSFQEIAAGDRLMVRGVYSADRSALEARQVVVMTRDDIARKQDAERREWRRRGILGSVTGIDPAKGEITVRVGRSADASTLVVVTAGRSVVFRRYAPDSVKFSDARPSALGELRTGDELRALGERSPDGAVLVAEQVVFGTFRVVSGSVTAADAVKGEVRLRDDDSGATLEVVVGPEARVRRLPPELAARLAARQQRSEGGGEGGEAPRWGRERSGGPEDLLDRLPAATLAELKVGDRIVVSSTKGSDASRLNAIALVAGLEALQPAPGRGRGSRMRDSDLPPELMDLGMSLP